ncbi:dihydrofolate reductase family protein [Leucobacter luti]|uniref:dihydrofolate reductase family protein n=1 Tax=Leucobacter luti TaxID=340320 RepID=UPI003D091425
MRRLRYSINVTLDGCVDHTAGLASVEGHRHHQENLERADAMLLGRVTYELMEGAWRPPASDAMPEWAQPFACAMDAVKKYVVTSTLERVDWNSEILRGDLAAAVRGLKEQPGGEILTGGVTLPTALASLGLIDEYEFVVQPRIAGRGPTLLAGLPWILDLELIDRRDLGDGSTVHRYAPAA